MYSCDLWLARFQKKIQYDLSTFRWKLLTFYIPLFKTEHQGSRNECSIFFSIWFLQLWFIGNVFAVFNNLLTCVTRALSMPSVLCVQYLCYCWLLLRVKYIKMTQETNIKIWMPLTCSSKTISAYDNYLINLNFIWIFMLLFIKRRKLNFTCTCCE